MNRITEVSSLARRFFPNQVSQLKNRFLDPTLPHRFLQITKIGKRPTFAMVANLKNDRTFRDFDIFTNTDTAPRFEVERCPVLNAESRQFLSSIKAKELFSALWGPFVAEGKLHVINQWGKFKEIPIDELEAQTQARFKALPKIKNEIEKLLKEKQSEITTLLGSGIDFENIKLGVRGALVEGLCRKDSDIDIVWLQTDPNLKYRSEYFKFQAGFTEELNRRLNLPFAVEFKTFHDNR